MDDTGERPRRESTIPTLEERREASTRAYLEMKDAIANIEGEISPEDATRLGALYAAYAGERTFHIVDENRLHPSEYMKGVDKIWEEEREQTERALSAARGGNYVPLKEYLALEAVQAIKNGQGDDDADIQALPEQLRFGRNLKRITKDIPSEGKPFVHPKPAWMDPKFRNPKV